MNDTAAFALSAQQALQQLVVDPETVARVADAHVFKKAVGEAVLAMTNGLNEVQSQQMNIITAIFLAVRARPEQIQVEQVDDTSVSFYLDGVWLCTMSSGKANQPDNGNLTFSVGLIISHAAHEALHAAGGQAPPPPVTGKPN